MLLLELSKLVYELSQGPSVPQQCALDASGTSREDTDADADEPQKRACSRCNFNEKKNYAVNDLARFFVTAPTGAAKKRDLYCRLCGKVVSVLTHGLYETLLKTQCQGHSHLPCDQSLLLESPA